MICFGASVSSSDQWGQLVPGCGACVVSMVDVSVLFSGAPRAVGGKSHCPRYFGRRGQQRWAGVLMSPRDPGFHGLCSGLGAAALCIWREAILPGAPGHQRGFLAKGVPALITSPSPQTSFPLCSQFQSPLLGVKVGQGRGHFWWPDAALLFRGLALDPKVYRCKVTPPKGSVLGCGQHQGPEQVGTQPWGQERLPGEGNIYLGVLKEELTRQEERTFQAGGTVVAEAPRWEQGWFSWTGVQVGSP